MSEFVTINSDGKRYSSGVIDKETEAAIVLLIDRGIIPGDFDPSCQLLEAVEKTDS